VNGPAPFSAGTRPAAVSAAARVLNDPAPTAVSTMSAMLIAILLARTGARVETKAFATTRVDTTRRVCIILLFGYDNEYYREVLDFKQYQLLQPFASATMNVPNITPYILFLFSFSVLFWCNFFQYARKS
jgi:hypothetical protein